MVTVTLVCRSSSRASSRAVITNAAKRFLQLIDLLFPPSSKFHKIFIRNNVKVSYSWTQNMGKIIKSRNMKLINLSNHHAQPCNCRKKEACRLQGKCRTENINCKCIVSTSGHPGKVYLGTAEGDFKKRYYNHISSFKNKTQMKKTTLAKYVWEQKQGHKKGISSNLCHLVLILQKAVCYAYTKCLKFWPTETKMSYWTKDQNLFLHVVILRSIYVQL